MTRRSLNGNKTIRGVAATLLAFTLLSGCATATEMAPHVDALQRQRASPAVSPDFRTEVSRLESEGLILTEAIETSLAPELHHLAAVFRRDKPKDPSQTCEFRIIESDSHSAHTIFRRNEFFFSFSQLEGAEKLNATDINKDGLKEILVQSSSGGNCWACNPIEIYQLRNNKVELIAAAPIRKIVDLNGDGVFELEVTDARWEVYDDFSHAASPGAVMIYTWKNGRYVYASQDFGAFYKSELDNIRQDVDKEKENITPESDDFYVGRALSLAITYSHMGDLARGLSELEVLLKVNAKSDEQVRHRREILDDFRSGESSKKLREMKYGDPMPLG